MLPDSAPGGASCNEQDGGILLICNYTLVLLTGCLYLLLSLWPLCQEADFPLLIPLRSVHSLTAFRFALISFTREHLWNWYHLHVCLNYPFLGREWAWERLLWLGCSWADLGCRERRGCPLPAACTHLAHWRQINTPVPPCPWWKPLVLLIQECVFRYHLCLWQQI